MTSTQTLNTNTKNFDWWLDNFVESSFVESSAGVHDTVAVAADGILVAMSQSANRPVPSGWPRRFSAGSSGPSRGAGRALGWEPVHQVVIGMEGGYLFVSSI